MEKVEIFIGHGATRREKRLGGREEGPGEVVARPAQRRETRIERGRAQIEREVRL